MPQAIAYLGFDGCCAEAMRFYERALDAKLEMLLSGADSPIADQIPVEHRHRILHARLALPDGGVIYAGDAMPNQPFQGMQGVSIALNYGTASEGERAFAALAEGGRITMPYAPAFWAERCGMVADRYGTSWIVNGALHPV